MKAGVITTTYQVQSGFKPTKVPAFFAGKTLPLGFGKATTDKEGQVNFEKKVEIPNPITGVQ
jgi:hypothetical protein